MCRIESILRATEVGRPYNFIIITPSRQVHIDIAPHSWYNYCMDNNLSGAALSYMGDAVYELLVRRYLLQSHDTTTTKLNNLAREFVCAKRQSEAVELILPHLTEQETDIYKRGRNVNGNHPKSATVQEYRRASGLEAVFGYLYLEEQHERLQELFDIIIARKIVIIPANSH